MMKIHCTINDKETIRNKDGQKARLVEFIYNDGYWSKWYACYSVDHAKELLLLDYPTAEYKRTKMR